jgi:hypothetical protein
VFHKVLHLKICSSPNPQYSPLPPHPSNVTFCPALNSLNSSLKVTGHPNHPPASMWDSFPQRKGADGTTSATAEVFLIGSVPSWRQLVICWSGRRFPLEGGGPLGNIYGQDSPVSLPQNALHLHFSQKVTPPEVSVWR